MSGKLTNYLENELLDHVLKVGAWNRPANLYVRLCTADPGETATPATLVEPSGGAYTPIAIDGNWSAGSSRATANNTTITFVESTSNWGTISHFAVADTTTTTGNVLAYGEVSPNKTITTGTNVSISVGDLDVSWNAGRMSTNLANKLLDHVFKGDAYTPETVLFVGLCTATPVDGDTGNLTGKEHSGDGYIRVSEDNWDAASGGVSQNTDLLEWDAASGSWGTVTHFAVLNTSTQATGNLLFYGTLTTARSVESGDTINAPIGTITVTMD